MTQARVLDQIGADTEVSSFRPTIHFVHQVDTADNKEKPVLFISKTLSIAKINYWPSKLEIGVLV